jgi:hypothetical protein
MHLDNRQHLVDLSMYIEHDREGGRSDRLASPKTVRGQTGDRGAARYLGVGGGIAPFDGLRQEPQPRDVMGYVYVPMIPRLFQRSTIQPVSAEGRLRSQLMDHQARAADWPSLRLSFEEMSEGAERAYSI